MLPSSYNFTCRAGRRIEKQKFVEMSLSNCLFFVAFTALLFEDPLSQIVSYAGYLDEIFALLGMIACFFFPSRNNASFLIPVLLYASMGFLGSIIHMYQPLNAVLSDAFLSLKFAFSLMLGLHLAKSLSRGSIELLAAMAKRLTCIVSLLLVVNFVFSIFPGQEYRFGVQIPRLFFSHSEYLAGFQVLLIAVGIMGCPTTTIPRNYAWVVLAVLNIAFTLRYKAIVAAVFAVIMFYVVMIRKKRFSKWNYIVLFVIATIIAWGQITEYYGIDATARSALTETSLLIAWDNLPLGTGFATFGSHMSKVFYSFVYYQYGISSVYGLMNLEGCNNFISDTFWPMVIGQTGVLGTLCFIWFLVALYRRIEKLYDLDPRYYAVALFLFVYLLIQSTASAAFVGPVSVPVGILIGICIGTSNKFTPTQPDR